MNDKINFFTWRANKVKSVERWMEWNHAQSNRRKRGKVDIASWQFFQTTFVVRFLCYQKTNNNLNLKDNFCFFYSLFKSTSLAWFESVDIMYLDQKANVSNLKAKEFISIILMYEFFVRMGIKVIFENFFYNHSVIFLKYYKYFPHK